MEEYGIMELLEQQMKAVDEKFGVALSLEILFWKRA